MNSEGFPADARVGLCHDWLTGMRGGERVLELLADAYPEAPIFTLLHNRGAVGDRIESHPVHCSPLQRVPGIEDRYRNFLPLMPWMTRSWRPSPELDLVISTSHCVAKSIRTAPPPATFVIVSLPCAMPGFSGRLFSKSGEADGIAPVIGRFAPVGPEYGGPGGPVRGHQPACAATHTDLLRARRRCGLSSGGHGIFHPRNRGAGRVRLHCQRDGALQTGGSRRARLHRKRPSIKGDGNRVGLEGLRRLAGPNIEFLGRCSDDTLRQHYRACRFLLFPGEEDYGIVPVEAMACGTPVIAYRKGGATETVVEGETGLFFDSQTPEALWQAVEAAAKRSWGHGDHTPPRGNVRRRAFSGGARTHCAGGHDGGAQRDSALSRGHPARTVPAASGSAWTLNTRVCKTKSRPKYAPMSGGFTWSRAAMRR